MLLPGELTCVLIDSTRLNLWIFRIEIVLPIQRMLSMACDLVHSRACLEFVLTKLMRS
jgi:hypothetical protein